MARVPSLRWPPLILLTMPSNMPYHYSMYPAAPNNGKKMITTPYMLRKILKDLATRRMTNAATGLLRDDPRLLKPSVEWCSQADQKTTVLDYCMREMSRMMVQAGRASGLSTYIAIYVTSLELMRMPPSRVRINLSMNELLYSSTSVSESVAYAQMIESGTGVRINYLPYQVGTYDRYNERAYETASSVSSDVAAYILPRYQVYDEVRTSLEAAISSHMDVI